MAINMGKGTEILSNPVIATAIEIPKAGYLAIPVLPDVIAVGEAVDRRFSSMPTEGRKALTAIGGAAFAVARAVAPLTVRAIEFHNEISEAKTGGEDVPEWIHVGAPILAVAADAASAVFTIAGWGAGGLPGVIAVIARRSLSKFVEHAAFGIPESIIKTKYTR